MRVHCRVYGCLEPLWLPPELPINAGSRDGSLKHRTKGVTWSGWLWSIDVSRINADGMVKLTSSRIQLLSHVAYSPHDHTTSHQSIHASSVPCRDHQSWCLAVRSPTTPGVARDDRHANGCPKGYVGGAFSPFRRPRSPRPTAWANGHDWFTMRRSSQLYRWPATSAVTGSGRSKPSAVSWDAPPGGARCIRLKACSSVHTGATGRWPRPLVVRGSPTTGTSHSPRPPREKPASPGPPSCSRPHRAVQLAPDPPRRRR